MPTIIRATALTLAIAVLIAGCEDNPFATAGSPTVADVQDRSGDLDPGSLEGNVPAGDTGDQSAPEPGLADGMDEPATLSLRDVTDDALSCSAMVTNLFLVAQQRIELGRVAIPEMDEWALVYANEDTESAFCALADEMAAVLFPD